MTVEQILHWTLVLGFAGAAGFGVWAAFAMFGEGLLALAGLFYRRRTFLARLDRDRQARRAGPRAKTEAEKLGLPPVNWVLWRIGSALAGFGFGWLLLGGGDYFFLAPVGLVAYFAPGFVEQQRVELARWRLRLEVRDFVTALRLALAFDVTLSRMLADIGARAGGVLRGSGPRNPGSSAPDETPLARALTARQGSLTASDPQAVLAILADDLDSRDLRQLLGRVGAARRGGLSFADALAASAREIMEQLALDAEYRVEAAPNELILPMLLALFPPALLLLLLPVASTLMESLGGAPH